MNTTKVTKLLWQIIEESDPMALAPEEQQVIDALHAAVMDYEDEIRLGDPSAQRHCLTCMVLESRCCC